MGELEGEGEGEGDGDAAGVTAGAGDGEELFELPPQPPRAKTVRVKRIDALSKSGIFIARLLATVVPYDKRDAALLLFLYLFFIPTLAYPSQESQFEDCVHQQYSLELLQKRISEIKYPDIPGLEQIHLPKDPPILFSQTADILSDGLTDPILERARELHVVDDFKYLSDLRRRTLSEEELAKIQVQGKALAERSEKKAKDKERAYLKFLIESEYEPGGHLDPVPALAPPRWNVRTGNSSIDETFAYTEDTWSKLARKTVPEKGGSLLPSPYPILIPAGRFQESYYWDSYFGAQGLLVTKRIDLAGMQVENLLENVRRYGFVPNGGRDYYLSRSQPPVLSSFVKDVFEASEKTATDTEKKHLREWLGARAYPLLKRDYENFWMDPKTRYDEKTGLNHHWDDLNTPRPERHGSDQESELGKSYRDVRAAAESGLDFTDAFGTDESHIAGVLLNSMLYKTERDLAWAANLLGKKSDFIRFREAAAKRKVAMNRYLWDSKERSFENYSISSQQRIHAISGDLFSTLFSKVASPTQARQIKSQLSVLEAPGGIRASNLVNSTRQWDGDNGWAPYQFFAIEGLRDYGYGRDARRIASKWVKANAKVHESSGVLYERIDVARIAKPETDSTKYPPQAGFLWTNGIFDWALVDVLGARLERGISSP